MSFCLNLEVDVFVRMFARVVLGEGVWGGGLYGFMGNIKGRGVVIVSVIMGHSFIFLFFIFFFLLFFFFKCVLCVAMCAFII